MKPLDCTHNPAPPAKTLRTTMNMRNLLFLVKKTMLYSLIYSLKHSQQVIIYFFSHPLNVAVECILYLDSIHYVSCTVWIATAHHQVTESRRWDTNRVRGWEH